jgi:hypothetical protein
MTTRSLGSLPARGLLGLSTLVLLAACGGEAQLPTPRPLVNFQGVRLSADPQKMQEVDRWFRPQMDNIERDPSFMIITVPRDTTTYPWETLVLDGDTARIAFQRRVPEAEAIYLLYAHFHLMASRDELEEWLPEASEADGYELESAVLERIADAWLYGRSIFDAAAYAPLDEILYAREYGYLDAMVFTARKDDFPAEREAWLERNPDESEEYFAWFQETFSRPPPGWSAAEG